MSSWRTHDELHWSGGENTTCSHWALPHRVPFSQTVCRLSFHCPYLCMQLALKDCVVLLVGTYTPVEESDDESRMAITTQVAEAYAAQKGLTYVECNPLDPEAVSRVVTHLLVQVVRQWGTDTITRGKTYLTPVWCIPCYCYLRLQSAG